MIASPCINVCTLDSEGRHCLGCFRTLDEIGAWASLPDAERARVMALLPARKRRLEAGAAGMVPANARTIACSACGASFGCGADDPGHRCWCTSFPPAAPSAERATCLCPSCLAAATATRSRIAS